MAKRVIRSTRDEVMGEISGKFGEISEIPSNFSLHTRNWNFRSRDSIYRPQNPLCTAV